MKIMHPFIKRLKIKKEGKNEITKRKERNKLLKRI